MDLANPFELIGLVLSVGWTALVIVGVLWVGWVVTATSTPVEWLESKGQAGRRAAIALRAIVPAAALGLLVSISTWNAGPSQPIDGTMEAAMEELERDEAMDELERAIARVLQDDNP